MISVLLPVYNAAETVESSIRSVLAQTLTDFECLVLDDGSTDGSDERIARCVDPRVRYIRYDHRGLTATLNAGLHEARCDIIARMDADDLCVPWRFERQHAALQRLPGNSILSSWSCMFSGARVEYCVRTPVTPAEIRQGLLLHSYLVHPGLMCYKNALIVNNGYRSDVEIDAFQDYETWLKIKDAVEFHILPEVLVYQRHRRDSLSNTLAYKHRIIYAIQRPYYDDLRMHFPSLTAEEECAYRGWREYFYGDRSAARSQWRKLGPRICRMPRIVAAMAATYLPESAFIRFTEWRLRYRLAYLLRYFTAEARAARRTLTSLLGRQA